MVAVPANGVLPDTKEPGPNVKLNVPISCLGQIIAARRGIVFARRILFRHAADNFDGDFAACGAMNG